MNVPELVRRKEKEGGLDGTSRNRVFMSARMLDSFDQSFVSCFVWSGEKKVEIGWIYHLDFVGRCKYCVCA